MRKRQRDDNNAAGLHRKGRESQVLGKEQETTAVYLHQARVWSDARTFAMWFNSFLRFVRRFTSKPALTLMDNHSSHANLSDPTAKSQ